MVGSINSILRFSTRVVVLFLLWTSKRRVVGSFSIGLPLCRSTLIHGYGTRFLSAIGQNQRHNVCLDRRNLESLLCQTRYTVLASSPNYYGNGNATNLEIDTNNKSFARPSLFRAGGRDIKKPRKEKRNQLAIQPIVYTTALVLAFFALLRLLTNLFLGTPNYVYYTSTMHETTTITSGGNLVRERQEDFRSNIPGLSGQNFRSRSELSNGLELKSPYIDSMRQRQESLERSIERQQLEIEEEMNKMMENFWRY